MKKIFMFLAAMTILVFTANIAAAQEENTEAAPEATEQVAEEATEAPALAEEAPEEIPLTQALKTKFIEGGAGFMSLIIICLIIGLALAIERILYLSFAKINAKALIAKVEDAIQKGGIEAAKDVCRDTRGPVASIFYQGLLKYDQGVDVVEKNIISFGSVQMSKMENGSFFTFAGRLWYTNVRINNNKTSSI